MRLSNTFQSFPQWFLAVENAVTNLYSILYLNFQANRIRNIYYKNVS